MSKKPSNNRNQCTSPFCPIERAVGAMACGWHAPRFDEVSIRSVLIPRKLAQDKEGYGIPQ